MDRPTHRAPGSTAARMVQWGQHALFVLLMLIAMAQVLLAPAGRPAWIGWVGLVLSAWYAAGVIVARRTDRTLAGVVWLLGLVLLWAPLALADSAFRWLSFPLFLLALHLFPTWAALVLVGLLTAVVAVMQVRDNPDEPFAHVLGPVLGALTAVGVASGYRAVLAESRARQGLVEELTLAHAEAERLSDELARSQRESGALAERARLARDIHDTLAQGFSSLLLVSRAQLAEHPDRDADRWRQVERTAADNLAEARRVVRALAPAALEEAPLADALRRLADQLSQETTIRAEVTVEGSPRPVPTSVEVALLRAAQGALANVRTHSQARRCVVTLSYEARAVALDVVDDGVGFDPDDVPASPGGFGLRGTNERIRALGGRVDVESAPGEGTAVSVRIDTLEQP